MSGRFPYEDTLQDPATGKFFNREQYEKTVTENPTKQIVLYSSAWRRLVSGRRPSRPGSASCQPWKSP
jgi:hypothetical protein